MVRVSVLVATFELLSSAIKLVKKYINRKHRIAQGSQVIMERKLGKFKIFVLRHSKVLCVCSGLKPHKNRLENGSLSY